MKVGGLGSFVIPRSRPMVRRAAGTGPENTMIFVIDCSLRASDEIAEALAAA